MFTPKQLVEDYRFARHALEEGHPGLYRYVTKEKLDRQFDETEKKLDHPMDVLRFFRIMAPMVAAIECGHTNISLPATARDLFIKNGLVLPFQVKLIGRKVYVFRDYAGADTSFVGSEILAINGMRTEKIVASLLATVSGDGEIPTSRLRQVGQSFDPGLCLLLGMNGPYHVTYRLPGTNEEKKVTLPGLTLTAMRDVSEAKYPQDGRDPDHNADLKFLDQEKLAVMAIYSFHGFADQEQKQSLAAFLHESFALFQQKGTQALILDLRNNGGGDDDLGKLLFSYLTDQPFLYYSDLILNASQAGLIGHTQAESLLAGKDVQKMPDGHYRLTSHPNWGLQQPSKPTFTGKVFVLMNGGSFSTTCEFLSMAHFHHRAVFIGEEAGGNYYGNTSGFTRDLTLPNTKVTLYVPLMKYVMAVSGYRYPKRGVIPNYPVQPTISDLLAGRDPEMLAALALAQKTNGVTTPK